MAELKTPTGLFIGSQELGRLLSFIQEDGYLKLFLQQTSKFGLFKDSSVSSWPNFRVEQGVNSGTIKHAEGIAFTSTGKIIYKSAADNIAIPDDGNYYYLKISHQYTNEEEGTVSIDVSGNLSGTGTKFKEILRGFPGKASVISLEGSSQNTANYYVNSVIDDENAILQGVFQPESGLKYKVVGTFDSSTVPGQDEKFVFLYDSCKLELIEEPNGGNGYSIPLAEGEEFLVARVRNSAGSITVYDLRSRYELKSEWKNREETFSASVPLLGIESIKWQNKTDTRSSNIVRIGWGFRSSNYSYNPSLNRVTINAGEGGRYKTTANFQDGGFNGYLLYTATGAKFRVQSSTKQGSQINLDLDTSDYLQISGEIIVVPYSEFIQILITSQGRENLRQLVEFPVSQGYADVLVHTYDTTSYYNVKYRYRSEKTTSIYYSPLNDTTGYYNENSFDDKGVLKQEAQDRVRVPYSTSSNTDWLVLQESSNSYSNIISSLTTGDVFGVEISQLDNDNPIINLVTGEDIKEQIFDHSSNAITLDVDHYIDISTFDNIGELIPRDGNKFILDFRGQIVLNGNVLRIVSGYVNTGDTGAILFDCSSTFLEQAKNNNARLEFTFDEETANWMVFQYNKFDVTSLPPTGAAGGDLEGTYPNPQIKSGVVNSDNIQFRSLFNDNLATASVDSRVIGARTINNVHLNDEIVNARTIAQVDMPRVTIAAASGGTYQIMKAIGFTKNSMGVVEVDGGLIRFFGLISTNTNIGGVIPAGYRPQHNLYIPCTVSDVIPTQIYIELTTAGGIILKIEDGNSYDIDATESVYASLSGICYSSR